MALYHWIREWSAPQHGTMSIEIQAIATMLAFGAAAVYARIARRQTDAIVAQRRLADKEYIERNRPLVFTERVEEPNQNVRYVAHNVGGGFALNVFYFDVMFLAPVSIGALAAGEQRTLPEQINRTLCDGDAGIKHVIIAEAPFTRTTQWTPTVNLRTQTAGDHHGQVIHQVPTVTVEPPRYEHQSLSDYSTANGQGFRVQLALLSEDRPL